MPRTRSADPPITPTERGIRPRRKRMSRLDQPLTPAPSGYSFSCCPETTVRPLTDVGCALYRCRAPRRGDPVKGSSLGRFGDPLQVELARAHTALSRSELSSRQMRMVEAQIGRTMSWPQIRQSDQYRGRWVALDNCRYDVRT